MSAVRFALALMCLSCATWAAEPTVNKAQPSLSMTQLLRSEASGQPVSRRAGIEASASSAADHWHVGEVLLDGAWTPLEKISYADKSRQLKQYEVLRGPGELNYLQHRDLARWCKTHKLPEQERAHWYGVLLSRSDDAEARKALGHQYVDGYWYTQQELSAADELSQRTEAEWHKWMPVMRKLAGEIASNNNKAKQQALERLEVIEDPSAVSSLEVTACQLAADQAVPFVRAISKQRSPTACLALMRISFAYPVDPRGECATNALKDYPKELYVPELLGMLSTPIQSEMETLFNPKGELLIRRAMFRETKDEKQQLRLSRLVQATALISEKDLEFSIVGRYVKVMPSGRSAGQLRGEAAVASDNAPEDQIAAAKNALEDQRQFESQLSSTNAELDRSARAAYVVLEKTTGEALERTPQAWWNWWQKYNERSSLGKSTRRYEFSKLDTPRAYANVTHLTIKQLSCLASGTLVHTAEGPKAIEKIRIGDMVVAQDVETGELALKPVLQTTVRPPKTTLTIVTDNSKIQATAGHRWFVAGQGWLMTRELKPDMLLHNATGTTRIADVIEDAKEQETYNLVVDGFHTYFVGPEHVLSFDNSEPIPTLRAVPGFGQIAF